MHPGGHRGGRPGLGPGLVGFQQQRVDGRLYPDPGRGREKCQWVEAGGGPLRAAQTMSEFVA